MNPGVKVLFGLLAIFLVIALVRIISRHRAERGGQPARAVAMWVVATPAVGGILGLIMAANTAGLVMLVMAAAATPAAEMGAAAMVVIDERST